MIGVNPSMVKEGESVAYRYPIATENGEEAYSFSFGVVDKTGVKIKGDDDLGFIVSDSTMEPGSRKVPHKDLLAVVSKGKTVSAAGKIVQFVIDRFVVAFSVLAGVTFVLLLIIVFALRKPIDYEDEYYDALAEEEALRDKK